MNFNSSEFPIEKSLFLRSIRIDKDTNNLDIMNSLISSETFNRTISEVFKQIQNGQCAFTWTGSYGSGKSSLAVLLSGLLSNSKTKIFKKAFSIIDEKTQSNIKEVLKTSFKSEFLPIVCSRNEIKDQIISILSYNFDHYNHKLSILDNIEKLSRTKRIILVIDELGKYLEYCHISNSDIYFLQELAEIANRSNGNFVLIGILHQGQ